MDIVSYSERKLTLEMTFRAKCGVKMTFRPLDTHVPLSAFNYVHLSLIDVNLYTDAEYDVYGTQKFTSVTFLRIKKYNVFNFPKYVIKYL